jgi:hypothetical protein
MSVCCVFLLDASSYPQQARNSGELVPLSIAILNTAETFHLCGLTRIGNAPPPPKLLCLGEPPAFAPTKRYEVLTGGAAVPSSRNSGKIAFVPTIWHTKNGDFLHKTLRISFQISLIAPKASLRQLGQKDTNEKRGSTKHRSGKWIN